MEQQTRREVEDIVRRATGGAYGQAGYISGALRNRAFTSAAAAAPGGFGAAASTTIYAAALVIAKASGIFDAKVTWAWQQLATGTWRAQVTTQTVAAGLVLGNTTQTGPGSGGGSNGAFTTSAAAGITVTNGGGAKTQFDTGVQTQGTAATAATFGWDGVIHNGLGTAEAGFPVGNQVLLLFTIITATAAITSAQTAPFISLVEQP